MLVQELVFFLRWVKVVSGSGYWNCLTFVVWLDCETARCGLVTTIFVELISTYIKYSYPLSLIITTVTLLDIHCKYPLLYTLHLCLKSWSFHCYSFVTWYSIEMTSGLLLFWALARLLFGLLTVMILSGLFVRNIYILILFCIYGA